MALSQKHRKLQGGFGGGILQQMEKDRENKCFRVCVFIHTCMYSSYSSLSVKASCLFLKSACEMK